jgi:DNA helicase-2/ATP-dependent DNA helicase PcrA
VHVMTVHQSKGLEFPLVVVPRLTDRRFPVRPREQPWLLPRDSFDASRYEGSINDEKRLFYVALTRARDRLILSNFLFDRGGRQQRPSEFLQHLLPMQSEGTLQVSQDKARAPRFVPRVPAPSEPLLTISFSDLWDYAECGHRYLMRQRGFRPKLDPALGYGKLAHHVLAWLGRSAMSGSTASGVQVAELVLKNFYLPFAGGERRDQLRQSLTNMLSDYLDKYGADLERVIETERRFEVPLAGARIVGRMDYLLRKDNGASGVEVLEFKVKHLDVGDREHHQVRLYAEAARREGLLPLAGTLHNLAKRSRESVDLNKPPPPEFLDEVSDLIAGIRTRRFFPTTSSDACSHCDFARVCEHCPGVALK